uniref:Uncharacterized protein n=1 Tax=Sicyonia whispovirus TaxID=2984283 RepID=A0A9C7BRC7_9VIRU|nr:MAG: hypothetical protein [Sicyonia whispovirus]
MFYSVFHFVNSVRLFASSLRTTPSDRSPSLLIEKLSQLDGGKQHDSVEAAKRRIDEVSKMGLCLILPSLECRDPHRATEKLEYSIKSQHTETPLESVNPQLLVDFCNRCAMAGNDTLKTLETVEDNIWKHSVMKSAPDPTGLPALLKAALARRGGGSEDEEECVAPGEAAAAEDDEFEHRLRGPAGFSPVGEKTNFTLKEDGVRDILEELADTIRKRAIMLPPFHVRGDGSAEQLREDINLHVKTSLDLLYDKYVNCVVQHQKKRLGQASAGLLNMENNDRMNQSTRSLVKKYMGQACRYYGGTSRPFEAEDTPSRVHLDRKKKRDRATVQRPPSSESDGEGEDCTPTPSWKVRKLERPNTAKSSTHVRAHSHSPSTSAPRAKPDSASKEGITANMELFKTMLEYLDARPTEQLEFWQDFPQYPELGSAEEVEIASLEMFPLPAIPLKNGVPFLDGGIEPNIRPYKALHQTHLEKFVVDMLYTTLVVPVRERKEEVLCRNFLVGNNSSAACKRARTKLIKNFFTGQYLSAVFDSKVEMHHRTELMKRIFKNIKTANLNDIIFLGADPFVAIARGCFRCLFTNNVMRPNNFRMPLHMYITLATAINQGLLFAGWRGPTVPGISFHVGNTRDLSHGYALHILRLGMYTWGKLKPGQYPYPHVFPEEHTIGGERVVLAPLAYSNGRSVVGLMKQTSYKFNSSTLFRAQPQPQPSADTNEIQVYVIEDSDEEMDAPPAALHEAGSKGDFEEPVALRQAEAEADVQLAAEVEADVELAAEAEVRLAAEADVELAAEADVELAAEADFELAAEAEAEVRLAVQSIVSTEDALIEMTTPPPPEDLPQPTSSSPKYLTLPALSSSRNSPLPAPSSLRNSPQPAPEDKGTTPQKSAPPTPGTPPTELPGANNSCSPVPQDIDAHIDIIENSDAFAAERAAASTTEEEGAPEETAAPGSPSMTDGNEIKKERRSSDGFGSSSGLASPSSCTSGLAELRSIARKVKKACIYTSSSSSSSSSSSNNSDSSSSTSSSSSSDESSPEIERDDSHRCKGGEKGASKEAKRKARAKKLKKARKEKKQEKKAGKTKKEDQKKDEKREKKEGGKEERGEEPTPSKFPLLNAILVDDLEEGELDDLLPRIPSPISPVMTPPSKRVFDFEIGYGPPYDSRRRRSSSRRRSRTPRRSVSRTPRRSGNNSRSSISRSRERTSMDRRSKRNFEDRNNKSPTNSRRNRKGKETNERRDKTGLGSRFVSSSKHDSAYIQQHSEPRKSYGSYGGGAPYPLAWADQPTHREGYSQREPVYRLMKNLERKRPFGTTSDSPRRTAF